MSTLYELTGDYETLLHMLFDEEEDEQCILDTLEGIEGEIEAKADGYAKVIRNMELSVAGIRDEQDRLQRRRKMIEGNISRLKKHLFDAMKFTGKTKFKTDLFSFSIAKNGGKQPLEVFTDDPDSVPEAFQKHVTEINKEAVRAALEKGEKLDFAALKERGESLRIR